MTSSAHEPCTVTLFRSSKEDNQLRRVRGEFREMPGMKLTIEQAAQRWSLDRQTCSEMFDSLVAAGFLQRDAFGRYHKAHAAPCHIIERIALVALMLAGGASSAFAQTSDAAIIEAFTESTRQYALLHRRAEAGIPPIDRTADIAAITNGITTLAGVIRVERRDARQGDLLTPAIAPLIRERIAAALAEHGVTVAELLAAEAAAGVDGPLVPLNVNDSFPWRYATGMPPCVIDTLPELPPELQYRIVGYTLVLVDVHASLIVDLLPDALQATELR